MDTNIVAEKLCRKCNKVKPLNCFSLCNANTDKKQSKCKDCSKLLKKEWAKQNTEKLVEYNKSYWHNNKFKYVEDAKHRTSEWRKNNPIKLSVWRKENPNYFANYRKAKSGFINAKTAKRRSKKLQATPTWADTTAIRLEYELAAWCTRVTGEKYHVDHIIPLQGKNVCGLHVHNNLRVVLALENLTKSNRFDVL